MTPLLAALLLIVQAEASRKGDLPLRVPEGWEGTKEEAAFLIVPKDVPAGSLYKVVVPELTRKFGTLKDLMAAAKATLAEVGEFKAGRGPVGARNAAGWDYEALIGTLGKEGGTILAQAVVLRKGEEEGMILVLADSVATMEKYSDAFTAMVRSIGAPKPAPPAAGVAGKVDLRYASPAGWTSQALDGAVLLEKSVDTVYDKWSFRLLILPSQPLLGGLRKSFMEIWATQVLPTIHTTVMPLPLVRRMKSGMACAFDQDPSARNQKGDPLHGGLYVLARGGRCVPILGFFYGLGNTKELDKVLEDLFESAEIPGAGPEKVPLIVPADLAGAWDTSSYSMANYVNSATGAYAGDASIATAEYFALNKDETFRRTALAVTNKRRIKEVDEGKWSVDDTELILAGKETAQRYRIFGTGSDPKAGTFLVLSTYSNTDEVASLSIPRRKFSGTWLKRKD